MRTPSSRVPMRRAAARRARWPQRGARATWARFARQPWPLMLLEFATVVGLLALLYLSQVAALTTTRQTLLQEQTRQTTLRRQDADLHAQLGRLQSPAYVEQRARALGMVPANPASVVWITLHDASH
ncbi:MAG: septum formation initiator family protein [Ktedonobacterales bacterium]